MVLEGEDSVPEALYEILQDGLFEGQPLTAAEATVARLLRVHRDWLNGGFTQTFYNLEAMEHPIKPYVQSYDVVGLTDAARIVRRAASEWEPGKFSTIEDYWDHSGKLAEVFDPIDAAYKQATFGNGSDDAIEAQVLEYVRQHFAAFNNSWRRANI